MEPTHRMGWSPTLTWLRWGPKYHLHRKVLQPPFAKSKVGQYQDYQLREALICCKSMLDDPENWVIAVRRFAVAIVLKISYGLDVDSPDSQWIKLAEESAEAIGKSGPPASSIMDRFPLSMLFSFTGMLTVDTYSSNFQQDTYQHGYHSWNASATPEPGATQ